MPKDIPSRKITLRSSDLKEPYKICFIPRNGAKFLGLFLQGHTCFFI